MKRQKAGAPPVPLAPLEELLERRLQLQNELKEASQSVADLGQQRADLRIARDFAGLSDLQPGYQDAIRDERLLKESLDRIEEQIEAARAAQVTSAMAAKRGQCLDKLSAIDLLVIQFESLAAAMGKTAKQLQDECEAYGGLLGTEANADLLEPLRRLPGALETFLAVQVNRPGHQEHRGAENRDLLRIPTPTHDHALSFLATQSARHQVRRAKELIEAQLATPAEPQFPTEAA